MCVDVKCQPDLTCKRIIRISRLKHWGERISSKRNDLRVAQRWQSAAFTLIKMSEPLTLLSSGTGQANICPAGRTDGRIKDDTGVVERRGPSGVNQEWWREVTAARGPVSHDWWPLRQEEAIERDYLYGGAMALLTGCDGWRWPRRAGEIKLLGAASLAISHRGNDLCPGWGGLRERWGGGLVWLPPAGKRAWHSTSKKWNIQYVNK